MTLAFTNLLKVMLGVELGQVVRRRSLPTVVVQLIETAPTSPQSESILSINSEPEVAKAVCIIMLLLLLADARVGAEHSLIRRHQLAHSPQLIPCLS